MAISFTFVMNHICPLCSWAFICSHAVSTLSYTPVHTHTHLYKSTHKQTNWASSPSTWVTQDNLCGWWTHKQPCHFTAWVCVCLHVCMYTVYCKYVIQWAALLRGSMLGSMSAWWLQYVWVVSRAMSPGETEAETLQGATWRVAHHYVWILSPPTGSSI